jgi:hypothetical protein
MTTKYLLVLLLLFSLWVEKPTFALNAVASIKKISGSVQVKRANRVFPGRKGLILNDEDLVTTLSTGKITILFRDGSEIRLYENTKFVIEKSIEATGEKRGFFHNLTLQIGSFWGKFVKGHQVTTINTPTATCGIKGTNVSFFEKNGKLDLSLSEGQVTVQNDDEEIVLNSGKMIEGITKQGSISDKIKNIPYRIVIKQKTELEIPKTGQSFITFNVQLIDIKSKTNLERAGIVHLSTNIDKILFPPVILNNRGFANFDASVLPFQTKDYNRLQLEIVAVAEGKEMMDIGSGYTAIRFRVPENKTKTIKIDANSGVAAD